MIDQNGAAPAAAPDASSAVPASPVFDATKPRLFEPVTITLDRERHLRLPFSALRIFEQETGLSPWDSDLVWGWPPRLDTMLTLLWVALIDEDPTLTRDQLEGLPGVEFGNINYIRYCLDLCWGKNQPPPEPKGSNGTGPNPKRPTG